jgi:hypothetical protein
MRAPHFLILDHFSIATLSSGSLCVLRVLARQTLEINMEVKDLSFPGPSLVKVVKYSTLAILSSSESFQLSVVKKGPLLRGFCREGRTVQ